MADYIIEPLDTSAEALFEAFVEFIQQDFPDWNPSEGQLDVIIGRYFAMQAAFTADMASRVQRAIYRYFGASLANIPPLAGATALGIIELTVSPTDPDLSYTLPYGSLLGITDANGDMQMFSTLEDADAPPGTTYLQINIQAVEIGAAGNSLSGTVQFIELVDWVSEAAVVGATAGGSDPEDDDTYIQRLTDNLALMAPRPILAADFAVMAHNVPGVWRAAVVDNFRPGTLDKQRIASNYTGGTYALSFQGNVTSDIEATTTTDDLYNALGALPGLDVTDLSITGGPLPSAPIDITFIGRYAYQDVAILVANTTGLTGGSSFTITETAIGTGYGTDMANSIAISAIDKDGNPLPLDTRDELIAYLASTRPQNFLITWVDPA
ncbi:MAG TPA: baseplate J/gp47 family protein, partial [Ktedonobacteraceae bacterium]